MIEDIRLVVETRRNQYGDVPLTFNVYILQIKNGYGVWQTMDVMPIQNLPPNERKELDDACSRMVYSDPRRSAAP